MRKNKVIYKLWGAFVLAFIMTGMSGMYEVQAEQTIHTYPVGEGSIEYTLSTTQIEDDDKTVLTVVGNTDVNGKADLSGLDELADEIVIGEKAFKDNAYVTEVILPSKTVEIGIDAFRNCGKLTNCELVDGIRKIQKGAFTCTALTTVTIPASCTLVDGGTEYADDDKYGSHYLGDNFGAFYGCTSLLSVKFAPRTTDIVLGSHLFQNCTALQSLDFPDQVDTLSDGICKGCKSLRKVTLPKDCTAINGYAFYGCDLYELDIPEGCLIIGKASFANNTHIKDVIFPKNCVAIKKNAFDGCSGLENLVFENPDVALGTDAFPSVTVAVNMIFYCDVSIYENSPSQYAGDNEIESKPTTERPDASDTPVIPDAPGSTDTPVTPEDSGESDAPANPSIDDSKKEETQDEGTNNKQPSTNDATTSQPEKPEISKTYSYKGMYYKVTGASTVTFMKPVNKKVQKITIPSKVKILGKSFKVTKINKKACYKCKKLKTVTIGNNVTVIEELAFAKCSKLETVSIGKGLKKIGKKAFYKDKKLKKLIIRSKKLTSVGKGALKGVPKGKKGVAIFAHDKKRKKYKRLFANAE